MNNADTLMELALWGTGNQDTADRDPQPLLEVRAALVEAAGRDTDRRWLLQAGTDAIARLSGRAAVLGLAPHKVADEDGKTKASSKLGRGLVAILDGQHAGVLPELLAAMVERDLVLGPSELPVILDIEDVDTRELLRPVLGSTGRWLSTFRAEWSWAKSADDGEVGGDEKRVVSLIETFQEGRFAERRVALKKLREIDPVRATEELVSTIKSDKAEHRKVFAESLGNGLSLADEPLLENLRRDRSAEVRRIAAGLLARLPDSGLVRGVTQRAQTWIARSEVGLSITLPAEYDPKWESEGIKEGPVGRIGKRAYWLIQTIAMVVPSVWLEALATEGECSPDALVELARTHEDGSWLLVGWQLAAHRFQARDWAPALYRALTAADDPSAQRSARTVSSAMDAPSPVTLLSLFESDAAAVEIEAVFAHRDRLDEIGADIFAPLDSPLPERVAGAFVKLLVTTVPALHDGRDAPGLFQCLPEASIRLPPSVFAEVAELPPLGDELSPYFRRRWEQALAEFQQTVLFRQSMLDEIATQARKKL